MKAKQIAIALASIGTLFAAGIVLKTLSADERPHESSIFFPVVFVLGPWLILDAVLIMLRWMRGVAIAAAFMLALEILIFCVVFLNPQSSTDAIAYVFKPGVQLLVLLPIGLLFGRFMDRRANDHGAASPKMTGAK